MYHHHTIKFERFIKQATVFAWEFRESRYYENTVTLRFEFQRSDINLQGREI